MRSICFLLQKPSKKKSKKKSTYFIPAFTSNRVGPQWGHSMMSFQCKGLRVEADRRLYCGGVLRSWEKAAGGDNRGGFLGLGALGGTEESSSSGIWRSGGAGRWSGGGVGGWGSFGSMGLFVAAAHLNACHSPCRPVWQRWVTRRCNSAPLPHKYTWHLFWRSTSADLEFLFLFQQTVFFFFSFPICKRNVVVFQISSNCVFFLRLHLHDLLTYNMWVLREAANDQQLTATVSCCGCVLKHFLPSCFIHIRNYSVDTNHSKN